MRTSLLLLTIAVTSFAASSVSDVSPPNAWQRTMRERLPSYGHRNWIVVADSAYPDQSAPGIETIVSNADQLSVVQFVLKTIASARHVTPTIYTDEELKFLNDQDAAGISVYRDSLAALLNNKTVSVLPHEQIIGKLDQVSRTFHVLIIKTTLTLPYTSVFMQLDCAYWPADAEARLRAAMAKHRAK